MSRRRLRAGSLQTAGKEGEEEAPLGGAGGVRGGREVQDGGRQETHLRGRPLLVTQRVDAHRKQRRASRRSGAVKRAGLLRCTRQLESLSQSPERPGATLKTVARAPVHAHGLPASNCARSEGLAHQRRLHRSSLAHP